MPWEAISNTRKSVSSDIQTLRSWLKKTRLRLVFSTHFLVFGYLMKHSSSCLIYYLNNITKTVMPRQMNSRIDVNPADNVSSATFYGVSEPMEVRLVPRLRLSKQVSPLACFVVRYLNTIYEWIFYAWRTRIKPSYDRCKARTIFAAGQQQARRKWQ